MRDSRRQVVRDGYEQVAARYLATRPRDRADAALLAALAARLPPRGRVLDAGCGAGVPATGILAAAGLTVVGLDLARAPLALARQLTPRPAVVLGDLAALPFPAARFDGLVSLYAVIHVPRQDHAAVFAEFRRVLRPGGRALLCVGANDLAADHDPDSWLGAPMFWSHFDADTNRALLADAGLRVVRDELVPDPMGHSAHLFATVEAAG